MRYLISFLFAVLFWFPIAKVIDLFTGDAAAIWGASIASLVVFLISMKFLTISGRDLVSRLVFVVQDVNNNVKQRKSILYAQAEEEFDKGEIDKGLWSQALVKANGDEKLRKVEYMKLRVKYTNNDYKNR